MQFDDAGEETKLDGACKMEADSRKKLDQRTKDNKAVAKDWISDLDEGLVESQNRKWQQELLQIERRRNDLLPKHEKMQKKSLMSQSLPDKLLQCRKIFRN